MSEVIKSGGMGKNPAIEKINRLNEAEDSIQAVRLLKERAFVKQSQRGREEIDRRKVLIEEFQISFQKREK